MSISWRSTEDQAFGWNDHGFTMVYNKFDPCDLREWMLHPYPWEFCWYRHSTITFALTTSFLGLIDPVGERGMTRNSRAFMASSIPSWQVHLKFESKLLLVFNATFQGGDNNRNQEKVIAAIIERFRLIHRYRKPPKILSNQHAVAAHCEELDQYPARIGVPP